MAGNAGVCRRMPPTASDDGSNGAWPTVQSNRWCGEWTAKEEAKPAASQTPKSFMGKPIVFTETEMPQPKWWMGQVMPAEPDAATNHDAAPAAKAAASDWGTRREELGTGDTSSGPRPVTTPITQKEWNDWLFGEDEGTLPVFRKAAERMGREMAEKHRKAWEDALLDSLAPQPVAYCIQCEPGDPKVHSLSFDKASLERIVTRHGGKIVGLYLREPAT